MEVHSEGTVCPQCAPALLKIAMFELLSFMEFEPDLYETSVVICRLDPNMLKIGSWWLVDEVLLPFNSTKLYPMTGLTLSASLNYTSKAFKTTFFKQVWNIYVKLTEGCMQVHIGLSKERPESELQT